jgi:hypothetical protein
MVGFALAVIDEAAVGSWAWNLSFRLCVARCNSALLICDTAKKKAHKNFRGLNAANPLKSLVSEKKKKGNASKFKQIQGAQGRRI